MNPAKAARVAVRVVPLMLGVVLAAWRFSIDYSSMTPREVRDVVQSSLFIALPGQYFSAVPASNRFGFRFVLFTSASAVGLVLCGAIGGIVMYNAHVAKQQIDCVAKVRSAMPVATRESRAAQARCYQ